MKEKIKDIGQLKIIATQVRRDILRMVYIASSGHPVAHWGAPNY